MKNSLETVVRKLFADEEFRATAINEPGTLDQFGLSEVERRSVAMLCKSLTGVPGEPENPTLEPLMWY